MMFKSMPTGLPIAWIAFATALAVAPCASCGQEADAAAVDEVVALEPAAEEPAAVDSAAAEPVAEDVVADEVVDAHPAAEPDAVIAPAPAVAPDPVDPAAPVPGDLMTRADELLTLAGTQEDAGNNEQAGRAYGQAQRIYMELAEQFPEWQPAVVEQRLTHCDDRIKAIIEVLLEDTDIPEPGASAVAAPPPEGGGGDVTAEQEEDRRAADKEFISSEISEVEQDLSVAPPEPSELRVPAEGATSGGEPVAPAAEGDQASEGTGAPASTNDVAADRAGFWSRWMSPLLSGVKPSATNAPVQAAAAPAPAEPADLAGPAGSTAVPAAADPGDAAASRQTGPTDSELPPTFTSLAAVRELVGAGDHEKARVALLDNITVEPANHTWRILIGVVECQAGRYAQALEVFKQVVREDPTNAKVHVLLGAAYLGLGDLAVARDQVTLALEIDPDLPEAHYDLARLCMAIDPPDQATALQHYERALRLGEKRDPVLERQLQAR